MLEKTQPPDLREVKDIERAMQDLDESISYIGNSISVLHERLGPVLRSLPDRPKECHQNEPQPEVCLLASTLNSYVGKCKEYHRFLEDIKDRLQL